MIRKFLSFVALGAVLNISASTLCLAQELDLSGVYRCEGTSPSGRPYRATVELAKNDHTYRLRWTTSEGTSLGIGIVNGNVLAVSYLTGTNVGVVLYKIEKGPRMIGQWAVFGADGQLYPETLTKLGMEVRQHDQQPPAADPERVLAAGTQRP